MSGFLGCHHRLVGLLDGIHCLGGQVWEPARTTVRATSFFQEERTPLAQRRSTAFASSVFASVAVFTSTFLTSTLGDGGTTTAFASRGLGPVGALEVLLFLGADNSMLKVTVLTLFTTIKVVENANSVRALWWPFVDVVPA